MSKVLTFLLVLFLSCATTGSLLKLNLGMTKAQVIDAIGEPDAARGSVRTRYNQTVEVWEYLEYKTSDDALSGRATPYWMYFCNSKLVQWGQAGDWRREADRIYEMRFE